jgi:hypothetical protein
MEESNAPYTKLKFFCVEAVATAELASRLVVFCLSICVTFLFLSARSGRGRLCLLFVNE